MTIIYAISGIAINHLNDWNPNYIITTKEVQTKENITKPELTKTAVKKILEENGEVKTYKKHYFPNDYTLKVFILGGTLTLDMDTGWGIIEKTKKRPVLGPMNYLHYNPVKWWTIFSDIFAGALVLLAFSGILIIKGKKGMKGRGAWLTTLGIIIPIIYLIIYYY
ncbi:PepSY-associated TM helix domain-containing protein [Candidatus Venteria ishoeyi]|nr:PepSY-associated TM helix domain-containing protein [Candidatus Venteria ishoeyi]